jgi:hypothetical protein
VKGRIWGLEGAKFASIYHFPALNLPNLIAHFPVAHGWYDFHADSADNADGGWVRPFLPLLGRGPGGGLLG